MPVYWSAIIGDVLHNLRAALDLLAVGLVAQNNGNPKGVHFPFADSADELERQIKDKRMLRAAPAVVDMLRALKPYRGGNLALRHVHDLDVRDKHQMLVPFYGHFEAPQGQFGGSMGGAGMPRNGIVIGQIAWGIQKLDPQGPAPVYGSWPAKIRLVLPFYEPLSEGEIGETLHGLVEEFTRIVDAFELLCFGAISQ